MRRLALAVLILGGCVHVKDYAERDSYCRKAVESHPQDFDYCMDAENQRAAADEQHNAEVRARSAAAAVAGAQGFSAGWNANRTVNCTTNYYGSTAQTTCQ